MQISVIQFFLVKKNISDIYNDIPPRSNDVTFPIHVYWVFSFRYLQSHFGYLEWTFWISTIEFLLGKTPISDIYNSIVTSQNVHFRYPKWKKILDIQNVILTIHNTFWLVKMTLQISTIHIMTSKNTIVDIQNVHSRYPKCDCRYLELKTQYTWMGNVTSLLLGRMTLWISWNKISTSKNMIVDICNYYSY